MIRAPKELILRFSNCEIEMVIVEIARYIEKGFRISTHSISFDHNGESTIEVEMVEVFKYEYM
jgi:hypothetical protein